MEEKFAAATTPPPPERSGRRRPPPPKAAPWLVIPHRKGRKDQAFYNLCEPENRTCRKHIPEMSRKSYWQKYSHQGWMIMICDDNEVNAYSNSNWKFGDCFLWNPVTLETIQLPNLLYWIENQYWICDCVLTSPPKRTNGDDNDGSMVFFLFGRFYDREIHEQVLVFSRPTREDKRWRTKDLSGYIVKEGDLDLRHNVESLLYFKGKLYGMCMNYKHLEIEIQLGHNDVNDENPTLCIRAFNVSDKTFFPTVGDAIPCHRTHYMESSDELFMIEMVLNQRGDLKVVYPIQVLKLNFSLLAWKEVKSLGDHVLFIGGNTTASCSAAELGLARGCLYFTVPEDQSLYIFEVEDNSTTIILPCLKLPTPWFSSSWMMMPTTSRVSVGRERMEDMFGKEELEDNIIEAVCRCQFGRVDKHCCLLMAQTWVQVLPAFKKTLILQKENIIETEEDKNRENKGQKQTGRELEQAAPWGNLDEDIVELIANHLHPVDYLHFRAVCKANRSLIPTMNWKFHSTRILKTNTYLSPRLVFSENNDSIYNFINPMHNNENYLMNLPKLLVGATIRFSKGGWLLMSKGRRRLFFYNPFTGAVIQLPALQDSYSFVGMSFSSLPTSSDCIVFGISQWFHDNVHIHFVARGNGIWWNNIFELHDSQNFMPCFNNPVFYDGAFYCLDYNGTLGVFDVEDSSWKVLTKPQGHFNALYPSFLVECDGNLLLVDLGHLGKSVGIFRLDFSKMVWVKVESLGKHMLFISHTSSLSAIAPHSRMENKIYFPRLHGQGILFYSLDTGKYHSSASEQYSTLDFYNTKERLNCTWIEPNWLQSTVQELDWLIS